MQADLGLEIRQRPMLVRLPGAARWWPLPRPVRFRWRRKAKIQPSVWAERHRVLPRDAAEPGLWKNYRVPYLAGILDASFFPSVQEIIVCAAPQTGKSEMNYTSLAYAVDRRPGNALVVFPDENTARDNSNDRIKPMLEDSPRLREFLTGYADDLGMHKIKLRNAIIYMAWANSAARLANRPLPYVILDEEDKYPATATKKEASPTDLAKKRTRTFSHMRKIWRTSSPSVETGPIWVALNDECQLVFDYWVKCPMCGGWQKMVFDQIKWPEDLRDPLEMKARQDCWYECLACEAQWDDESRNAAVRAGEWRDRDKGLSISSALASTRPVTIGFHIPSWLSPFVHLWEVAHAFLEYKSTKNLIKLRDFRNGHQALPWESVTAERSEDRILALADERPRGLVPGGARVACLLAGCDTQDDGFFFEIRAFGFGLERESWCIREGKVPTLDALAQMLFVNEYRDADDNPYPVRAALIDSAGHRTHEVYDFCRQHPARICPTVGRQTGAAGNPITWKPLEAYPDGRPMKNGPRLFRIDTTFFKSQLAGILEILPGDPGCWWYHRDVTQDWARQMTVEGLNAKGVWENPHHRANHAWDAAVLLLALHRLLGVANWPRPGTTPEVKPRPQPPKQKVERLW